MDEDGGIRRVRGAGPQAELDDLRERPARTRWPDEPRRGWLTRAREDAEVGRPSSMRRYGSQNVCQWTNEVMTRCSAVSLVG
jgi:hypothetical protein